MTKLLPHEMMSPRGGHAPRRVPLPMTPPLLDEMMHLRRGSLPTTTLLLDEMMPPQEGPFPMTTLLPDEMVIPKEALCR